MTNWTDEQITATADALQEPDKGIRTKRQERAMFRGVNTFCSVLEQLQPHEQQAWLNWLQAKYGTNYKTPKRQAERERHDSDESNERTD